MHLNISMKLIILDCNANFVVIEVGFSVLLALTFFFKVQIQFLGLEMFKAFKPN